MIMVHRQWLLDADDKMEKSIEELKRSAEDKAAAVKSAEDGAADLKKRVEELAKSLEEHEKEYQGVVAGKSSGNEEKCLEDQLADAKVAVGKAETELKQDREMELNAIDKIKDKIRNFSSHLGNIDFSYSDPVKNFDRSKVKGVVAKLIKVKDSSAMTALQVCAGGKLYNVVVDNENTSKQLVDNGGLRGRVTIIPLNKIERHPIQPGVQNEAAKMVGKGNAEVALSLVGYNDELQSAMEFVFGSTFVYKTRDIAEKVAFNQQIRT